MALTLTTVTGRFPLPDNTVPVSATAIFTLSGPDTTSTDTVLPMVVRAPLDGSGNINVDLWRNGLGGRGTYYRVEAEVVIAAPYGNTVNTVQTIKIGNCIVGATSPVNIGAIITFDVPSNAASYTVLPSTTYDADLAGKAPINNPTFTGTVGGITKSHVGLSDVDNTADADKPVSTAQQVEITALQGSVRSASSAASASSRDGVDGFAYYILDQAGTLGLGLTDQSQLWVGSLRLAENSARDGGRYVMPITDLSGNLSAGVRYDGAFEVGQLALSVGSPRDGNPFAFSIHDTAGNVAFGLDAEGRVVYPDALTADSYVAPAEFSTSYQVANVREFQGFSVALRQDRGQSYDVMKLAGGTTAAIQHYGKMLFDPTGGQSNAGFAGDAGGPALGYALMPNIALTFSVNSMPHGTTPIDESSLVDLKPLSDAGYQSNTPATLGAFALEHVTRELTGETTPGIIGFTAWYGGQPLSSFVRGTEVWNNLMKGCRRASVVAAEYGREVDCKAYTFIQGESGPLTTYEADLTDYVDDVLPEIALQMGLATPPKMIIVQTNSEIDSKNVALAQLAVSQSHASVILAAPMYHLPLADVIHASPIGRMVMTDALAVAKHSVLTTGDFTPLQPASATLTGAVIDIVFDVPGNGLVLDDDWVEAATDHGFAFTDSTSSATISTVAIVGSDTVRITLSNTPSGATPKVSYAVAASPTVSGWIDCRGQLYSPTDIDSAFARLGYSVPSKIRHYSVKFEMEL